MCFLCIFFCFVSFVVSSNALDCMERLILAMKHFGVECDVKLCSLFRWARLHLMGSAWH